jgi:RNA polymerase sigma factor (sigma-70 family)
LPPSPSDPELVQRCLAGDESAWEALVGRYADLVFGIARRQGLRAEACGDTVQDVFLALVRSLPRLRRSDRLLGWIVRTARREAWLKRSRGRRVARDEALAARPEADPAPLPADAISELELRHLVREAYATLGERCRQVLDPLFVQAETKAYARVARDLGLAVGSLGSMRRRCLRELRRDLVRRGYPVDRLRPPADE